MTTFPMRASIALIAAAALVVTLVPADSASAADPWDPYGEGLKNTNTTVGYPRFVNAESAIPDAGVAVDASGSYLGQVFARDLASGAGTEPRKDFWVDKMLARDGVQPDEPGGLSFNTSAPENINYDNNDVLFTRGRALYMEDSAAGLGFRGDVAYIDSLGDRSAYTLTLSVGGQDVALVEDTARRHNTPSYWYGEFTGGGLRVTQTKFVDQDNVLVEWVRLSSTDGSSKTVSLSAASPFAGQAVGDELRGGFDAPNAVTRVETRLSGDGFAVSGSQLSRTAIATADGVDIKLQMGFLTTEIPAAASRYADIKAQKPQVAFASQTSAYNKWWADNVPYLQTPSPELDKSMFYRWWLLRTNFLDAAIPGNDYQFPTSIEGVYGQAYNNAIVLTAGMFIDDMKYFRDPSSAYGTWLSAGEVARQREYIDNPGNPRNWSSSYANYISESAWESYRIHGGDASIAEKIAEYADDDVAGQLSAFDGNRNGLIEYSNPAFTGNDVDAVSFSWRGPDPWHSLSMDRPESAYLYSGARAAAEAYRLAGDTAAADRMDAQAATIKKAVLDVLWEDKRTTPDEAGFYGDMIKGSYSANGYGGTAGQKIPWKEVNMFYPYTVGLMPKPGDPDFDQKYLRAFRLFVDSSQYSPFPFFTANQADAKARAQRDPGRVYSNNFSTINSTVMFRLLSSTIRDYPNSYLTADYYKKLLYWNAWASYEKGDVTRPNENEFWAHGSAENGGDIKYRSWIHQTQLGTTNFTVIEDAMGLQSRTDDLLEVSPIDIGWDHFAANNIRYHDRDVSIVWDAPGGTRYYPGSPEGYSVYVDGKRAFTLDSLAPAVYDPSTGEVTTSARVVSSATTALSAAAEVRFAKDDRVTGLLARAGVDVDPATSSATDRAAGAAASASFTAAGTATGGGSFAPAGAVDGSTVNEPFWGTAGSPNESDWLEVDLGRAVPVDEARVFFYRSSSSGTVPGYAVPSRYVVEYFDGTTWTGVARQGRTPSVPEGNLNVVRFEKATASKFRVLVYHAPGARTGIKEIQLRETKAAYEPSPNAAPTVSISRDAPAGSPRVRFTGSVGDDGLPSGALTQKWEVVSTPSADARVTFSDARGPNTVATFSERGDYRLRFVASDGEASTTFPVEVTVSGELPPGPDLTATAQIAASYTASWNRLDALRDGRTVASAAPTQTDLWGSYRDGARPAQDTVTYTWAAPQRVSAVSAWFWNDQAPGTGNGVALPAGWKVEYLNSAGGWSAVDTTSYPVAARGEESRATFGAVETTGIRATFTASAGSSNNSAVALSEVDVYTEAPQAVEPVAVRTSAGSVPALPTSVYAVYQDGRRAELPVEWEAVDASRFATPGQVSVNGILTGSAFPVTARVSVGDSSNDVSLVEPASARTFVGLAPDLPRTVVLVFSGGTGARESRPVKWDAVDSAKYSQTGTFEVRGTVAGTSLRPVVTVTVEQDPTGAVPPAPTGVVARVEGSDVFARWSDSASGPTVAEYQVLLTPLGGGSPTTRTATPDSLETTFRGVTAGEYTVSVRARAGQKWSPAASVPVGVLTRPTAPRAVLSPAVPNGAAGWYTTAPTLTVRPDTDSLEKSGTLTASYTAPWNALRSLNDGAIAYQGGAQTGLWGTWADSRPAERTVEYRWAVPKVLTSSSAHFWSESTEPSVGNGVGLPKAWRLQYIDPLGAWADVPGVEAYPVMAGRPSVVSFPEVTTTGLRMVLEARTDGRTFAAVGMSEWGVRGWDAGTRVEELRSGRWAEIAEGSASVGPRSGEEPLRTRSVTASGLISPESTLDVKVDSVAPVTSVTTDPASGSVVAGGVVTAKFTSADTGSGVATTEYSLDAGTTWATATAAGVAFRETGSHTVQYRSKDVAGNVEATKSVTVSVTPGSTSGARVTITSADEPSADGWHTQNVLVRLTAPQTGQKVQYRINGGEWKSYSSTITVSANGTTTIGHRLLASNVVVGGSEGATEVKLDKQAPIVSAVRTPATGMGTPRNPISVTFSSADTASGLARTEYRLNSGAWTTVSPGDPVVFGVIGDWVLSYRAVDRAGTSSATKSMTFSVVADAPTTVKANVKTARAGAAISLTLGGFVRWDDVTVTVGGARVATVMTDQNGTAKLTVRIPAGSAAGDAVIAATGTDRSVTARTTVTVTR